MTDGYKIKRVLTWVNNEEKQIYPAGWKPNANTLLYLPLESDVVDRSGKTGISLSTNGITFTTVGGVPSAHVGSVGGIQINSPYPIANSSMSECTVSICVTVPSGQSSNRRNIIELSGRGGCWVVLMFRENTQYIYYYTPNGGGDDIGTSFMPYAGKWINIILVNSSAGKKLYINGQLVASGTGSSTPRGNYTATYEDNQMLLTGRTSLTYGQSLEGNAREIILENKAWSSDDASKYYQQIKAKLGF